ncbi:MAG: hypothetical protein P4M15_05770 [Alphaproteobacteria bacterium]|nr:hypothetical protein [Alphaproteobacteria bacterium]
MKPVFAAAAEIVVAPRPTTLLVIDSASADRAARARFYFYSPSKLARDVKNRGRIKRVIVDSVPLVYTDKNFSGKMPRQDSEFVVLSIGQKPGEKIDIIDKVAYAAHQARRGLTPKAAIKLEVTRPPKARRTPGGETSEPN